MLLEYPTTLQTTIYLQQFWPQNNKTMLLESHN